VIGLVEPRPRLPFSITTARSSWRVAGG